MILDKVFINRTLNMRKIKYIGLDMDHTLIRYNSYAFEELAYRTVLKKLVEQKSYPDTILALPFQFDLAIRGLVIDRKKGNLLKVSRHGAIRRCFHGSKSIDFPTQNRLYKSVYIDFSDSVSYFAVDTSFSIAITTLFAKLIDLKDSSEEGLPSYEVLMADLMSTLDEAHRDGSLKDEVVKNLDRFIVQDEAIVHGLERYLKHDKKLFILTNSDFQYTKTLLDWTINPFLKEHSSWMELFEMVITNAEKPRFFFDHLHFLKVNPQDGSMTNYSKLLEPGIYQGGCAEQLKRDLRLEGDEILYIGDHIYSDILRVKKSCNWRTALVIEELEQEINSYRKARFIFQEIDRLMRLKEPLEQALVNELSTKIEYGHADDHLIFQLQAQITELDQPLIDLIHQEEALFNPYWGEVMRAGNEESFLAQQVDRFACIYMAKLADLFELSPRTYFRASRRPLAHELI